MAPPSKVWPSTPEIDHFRPLGVTDNFIDKKTLLGMVESKSGRGSFDHVVRQMGHSCFAALTYERSQRGAAWSVRRVGM